MSENTEFFFGRKSMVIRGRKPEKDGLDRGFVERRRALSLEAKQPPPPHHTQLRPSTPAMSSLKPFAKLLVPGKVTTSFGT